MPIIIGINQNNLFITIFYNKITNSIRINCSQILILTDLFGATPSNITQKLLQKYQNAKNIKIKAVSGLSLPMLLKVIFYRNQNEDNKETELEQLCQKAIQAVCDGTKIYE